MEPSDLTVGSVEEEATLTCDAKGIPPPQYRFQSQKLLSRDIHRWSLNGTLIDLSTDSRRRLSGGNLVIRSLDRAQDGGIYQCTAFNPHGAIVSRRASLQFACESLNVC
ncbi:hypothetical protein DNTS_014186 [Danionella cerebrum]|uniref:Ig-like domain-containing protein n=1 Tax=Danionella cerebrum TaxID=2873325 RepID=A0A553MY95_9TELE|nr:hypothetical protein DNTS_014186 [Danionella translucida]